MRHGTIRYRGPRIRGALTVCGRYGLAVDRPRLVAHLPHVDFPLTIAPRFNIAPTQDVLAVRPAGARAKAVPVRWGIGLGGPDGRGQRTLINVRSETALEGERFRLLLDRHRVLLPASHFYEWEGRGRSRRPVSIGSRNELMAFAGLLGTWHDPATGEVLPAVAILTCPPNDAIAPFHQRMPVILPPESWRLWLDREAGAADVAALLVPCPGDRLLVRPASRLVNDPRNDGPELLAPDPDGTPPEAQLSLFDG